MTVSGRLPDMRCQRPMKAKILYCVLGVIVGGGLMMFFLIRNAPDLSLVRPGVGMLNIGRWGEGGPYDIHFTSGFSFGEDVVVKTGEFIGSTGTVTGILLQEKARPSYRVEITRAKVIELRGVDLEGVRKKQ